LCSFSETKLPLDIGHFCYFFCWKKVNLSGKRRQC
jgi:hypothetical protein